MEYTVERLARMSGVSARTLRYYDQIGLLKPERVASNGYRIYGRAQVDALQQILFYRELEVPLDEIQRILCAKDFDRRRALEEHLTALSDKRERLDTLINNVRATLCEMKGDITMADSEKFKGFKQKFVKENEEKYGKELRERFGDEAIDASNDRLKGMSETDWDKNKALETEIAALIKRAAEKGDPECEDAQKACALHAEWLKAFWKKGAYSKQAHLALGRGYLDDERFKAYYDAIAPEGARFFVSALEVYCGE